jgi:hypothetical protein
MNFIRNVEKPRLIEPGIQYFLGATLNKCHTFKEKYNNILINGTIFIIFAVVIWTILYFSYKGKLTPEERQQRDNDKYQYIMTKIKNFQHAKKIAHQDLITNLPLMM